jgi:hypothetical protein
MVTQKHGASNMKPQEHPQMKSELGRKLTNYMATFLHHPQLAPEHSQWKAEAPKGGKKSK